MYVGSTTGGAGVVVVELVFCEELTTAGIVIPFVLMGIDFPVSRAFISAKIPKMSLKTFTMV
jgi:hypothetical protein